MPCVIRRIWAVSGFLRTLEAAVFYDGIQPRVHYMVKLGLEQVDKEICLVMGREEADRTRTVAKITFGEHTVQLRFLVTGDKIRGQYRPGGAKKEGDWKDAGE